MPYGMPKWMPQPETDARMERCVTKLVAAGKDKTTAIRECKAGIIRHAAKGKNG